VAFCVALLLATPAAAGKAVAGEVAPGTGAVPPVADLVRAADAAFDRGEYRQARALYEEAVQRGAEGVHALRRLALLESWDGDLSASIACYRQALAQAPGDLDLSLELAKVLSWKNELGEAIRLYEALRATYPDDARVLLGLGQALAWRGRYAEADAVYRGMEERRLEPIQAHVGRARVLAWQGSFDRAAHFYRDVLRADSMNLDARLGLAEIEHWQGLDRAAREQSDNIVLDHPESREAQRLQTEIHQALDPHAGLDAFRFSDNDSNRVDTATATYTFMAEPQTSVRIAYATYDAEFRCTILGFCRSDDVAAAQGLAGQPIDAVVDARAQALTAGVTSRLIGPLTFHARLGGLREETIAGGSRSLAIGGGFLRWQVGPRFAVVGAGSRDTLLDTVPLIDKGIHVDGADVTLEYRYRPSWTLSGSGGYGTYSDGNARRTAAVSLEWRLPTAHPFVSGVFAARYRAFNADKDDAYFDPRRYDSELLTVAIWDDYRHARIFWRIEETYGRQAFDAGAAVEAGRGDRVAAEYVSFGVGFGTRASLEAFYSHSNYALQLATGFTSSRSGFALRFRF